MKHSKFFKAGEKSNTSIRWKLFMYLMFFTVIILIILWLTQVVFLEPIYKFIKVNEIKSSARIIKNNFSKDIISDYAFEISSENDLCVYACKINTANFAFTIEETLYAHTLNDCAIHKISFAGVLTLYNAVTQNDGELLQYFKYNDKTKQYYSFDNNNLFTQTDDSAVSIIYSQLIDDGDSGNILLMVNSTISPVNATVKTLNNQLIVISIVLTLLALILTLFFSRQISKPIEKINDSAKILATGNYNVEFKGDGYKEISELAETLNYASSELSKTDQMKSDLIGNISHDLRTPLSMIIGYGEVMRDIPDENTPENVQIIIDEAVRLASLVNDVLDISKLQSGTQEFRKSEINLTQTIKTALTRYNKFMEQDGYNIEFIYDEEITVHTDETRLLQVLYNLINNAITYTGDDKHVTVTQDIRDKFVRISVADTGEGISPEHLKNIWERYYKVNKVHKRARTGTGLGLSIVKSIMEMAGGHYGVESVAGEGSTFWIELPKK